ncbi:MAG TPA: AsnC family transcriptional regulator [Dehalococcoidia bacterium]|jgi:DNA-binding Lrp family transcriptional regulator|nr:AsnC family transcriptional regulator [Dehalococcoidia bacterium]
MPVELDDVDRRLLNRYQGGMPVSHRPYAEMGEALGIPEDEVIARIRRLLEAGALSRVGPILNAPRLGGERTLAAMRVPPERFDEVAAFVNSLDTVSHNYEREHELNMWFVISSDDPEAIERTIATIERETGLRVVNLPTLEEFFVDLRFEF